MSLPFLFICLKISFFENFAKNNRTLHTDYIDINLGKRENMGRTKQRNKQVIAVLLAFALLLSNMMPVQLIHASDADASSFKLVNMVFTKAEPLPYTDHSTGITAELKRESDQTTGYATNSLNTTNWDGEVERYWQIAFTTKNFKDLSFVTSLRSSGTGPRDFKVQYSINGTDFIDLTETLTVTKAVAAIQPVALPDVANDQDKVYVRVTRASTINVNGTELASTGVSNINNIIVTGTSIDGTLPEVPSPSPVAPVTTAPVTTAPAETTPAVTAAPESPSPSPSVKPQTFVDPIGDEEIPEGVITLDQAYNTADGTEITLIGQVQYKYGKNGSVNTTVLEDIVNGEIYGFQVYSALNDFAVGDVITVKGKVSTYGNVKQISPADAASVTKVKATDPIGAQKVTISQLLEGKDAYLSEYVLIQDVTLGTYNTKNTEIKDSTGNSLNIYQGAAFPEGLTAGSQANVYGVYSKYNTTYQLRNGITETSYKKTGYEVESSITTQLAKWAGTAQFEGNVAYGDLYADNDFLDKAAEITLSNGKKPQYEVKNNNGGTDYFIGANGLKLGEYYQIKVSTEKYADVKLSFSLRSSAASPKYYYAFASADGVNYERVTDMNYTIKTTTYNSDGTSENTERVFNHVDKLEASANMQSYQMNLPNVAANAETCYIRLQVAQDNTAIDANKTLGTTYVARLTNVSVTGSPIISDDICRIVEAAPEAGEVALGTEVTLSCATKDAAIYYSINGSEEKVYDENSKPALSQLPAVVTAYAKADGKETSAKTTYAYTQAKVATVKASPNGGAVKLDSFVKLTCPTEGAQIYYSLDDGKTFTAYTDKIKLTKLPQTMKVYATLENCIDSEVKELTFTERENDDYNVYFGQIHSHTNYSDGTGTADDAFKYASTKVDSLDYFAVTDHSNSLFVNAASEIDNVTLQDGSASKEWLEGKALAEQYTTDKFVGLMGFEMTWSGGAPGHMNTFNTEGFLHRNQPLYKNGSSACLTNYYKALKEETNSISQFNHPGTTFGDFFDFGFYDSEIDQLITLVEVGNGEGAIGSNGYFPSYEYYTRALDKGWHLAPTNNQDNHKGYWGSANTARTVILADSLNRDNIYDALRNMRTYATEDNNFRIKYTLNDEIMGTILEEKPDSVNIAVSLEDPDETDKIGKVEVIVNGGLSAASKTISSNKGEVNFTLSPDYSYYYIKVTQADGDIAVTAPVWISEVDAAGVSSVTTDTSLAVQNESVDVTAEFYNNNTTDLDVQSIEFAVEGNVFKTLEGEELEAAGLAKLASQTSKSYGLDFIYDGLGSATVTVTMRATVNGAERVYTNKLTFEYVPRKMVNTVIVDGTHNNDYVTGYYGGNFTNLGKLAAGYYQEVKIKKDVITEEDLKTCSLLILSAPAKKSGTTKAGEPYDAKPFEADFIKMVADYVKNGGKVVICGLADYQDSEAVQTSTELNKVLAAMGATTRINSDELCDDSENGGQAYRLYLDDYNMDSRFMDGFVDGMKYSCYSGCGIILDQNAVASGKAEAIVKGHPTTYSLDSKKYDNNYVAQEMGNIVALGHETVGENGGEIWVGGTVFLSNYEVDEKLKNNQDELSYFNTLIATNILKQSEKPREITPIADVRKAAKGEIFTVEGYVTAGTTNPKTTFFDCIYMEDETAGIDIFPYAEAGLEVGQKIQVTGYVADYQGDIELMLMSCKILDDKKVLEPKNITTKQATDYENFGGSLVKVTGQVTKVEYAEGTINYIYVKDESGAECKALTDGYIGSSADVDNTEENVKVGNTVSIAGILYMNPDGVCIRVRDRAEIVKVKDAPEPSKEPERISKITYVLNGGLNAKSNPVYYTHGYTQKLASPTKKGYTFAGWYTDASFKKQITQISTSQRGDITVYAKWKANSYKIAFNKNAKDAKGTMKAVSTVYDKTVKLPKNSFTRKGYVFAGWVDGTNKSVIYKNGASVKNLTARNGATVTLYAKWTKVSAGTVKKVTVKAAGKNKAKVSWSKVTGAAGYRIKYSSNSSFKGYKTMVVSEKQLSKTLSGLKAGRTYYVKVRAFKKDSANGRVYGKYSAVEKFKIQK